MKSIVLMAAVAALALPVAASAHVMFAPGQAATGSTFVGALRVGHGCSGSPTVSLRVDIPEGVSGARPQAKPGWTIAIERTPLKTPMPGEGGKMQTDRVSAITWTGDLPDDEFDDFVMQVKLPKAAGPVYFPATQVCRSGRADWRDIPVAGQASAHPAPVLMLTDGMAAMPDMPGMDMSHMGH